MYDGCSSGMKQCSTLLRSEATLHVKGFAQIADMHKNLKESNRTRKGSKKCGTN
jgi:hypothetical protein